MIVPTYEEVLLKKSYFHGDTIGFAQQTLRYIQPHFLYVHKCFERVPSASTDRSLNCYDPSAENDYYFFLRT